MVLTGIAAAVSLALFTTPGQAAQGIREVQYTGGGTVVVKQSGQSPAADEGVLVCSSTGGMSVGGGCLSFGTNPLASSVLVQDNVSGTQVAFQVCIDNNHDGRCVSPDEGPCADQIFFSHNDEGLFFNPLGPLPIKPKDGCPGGVWNGYVVFLCNGVHAAGNDGSSGTNHSHPATAGHMIQLDTPGSGFGNFCGGSRQDPSNKQYVVT
jgi:hypothetical protein